MTPLPLEREAILPRLDDIRKNLQRLEQLSQLSAETFSEGDPFDLAQHHLRLALEGIFHISSHILSRMPGGRAVEYKEIAIKMGELGVISMEFAKKALVPMAVIRNLLVHHYSKIQPERLRGIIQNHREDIEQFCGHIKDFLKHSEKFGLTVT